MASYEGEREARPEISPSEIELEKLIGEGTFGKVYRGKCRGKEVAVKVFKRADLSEDDLKAFKEEVKIMSKIVHPNIVLFLGACVKGDEYRIVTDLMPKDLETLFLKEGAKGLSQYDRLKMLKHAALGMNWLHCSNPVFIHRDLKLSNLLVDNDYKVYVCDFGLTQMKPKDVNSLEYDPHGSPLYMAPEVFVGEYDEKCDIYSFGVIMWEAITLTQAYAGISENLPAFIHSVVDLHERPEIPGNVNSSLRDLMADCWAPEPKDRPSFSTIIERLDKCLVDLAIRSRQGRKFWKKKKFFGKEEVGWKTFEKELRSTLQRQEKDPHNDVALKCLRAVLADDPKKKLGKEKVVVNILKFGKILDWFGPFEEDSNDEDFLDRLENMLRMKWFHGDISTPKATDRLNGLETGTFLVRFSSSAPGCYTISSVDKKGRVVHQRITYTPKKGFEFWNNHYDTLQNLIAGEKKQHNLLTPCQNSPYAHLFPSDEEEFESFSQAGCYVVSGSEPANQFAPPASESSKPKKEKKKKRSKE
mmetsp:Transcript_17936/g.50540  ORF Transcript_17936/g.50540 Transcript_17936/m.50540 type:complete len:529 (+) Transcript_17936:60-1646(+)|eukprot:CAMPEP_0119120114 /NCGR_PEP_ID=MMETSP1310-20130426/1300_1 /TAXON_ID=464262 /ORGANISM="Genus nov. species nov., Strain RCC2339" /LENGTH=528 /DNA_ID=CAMNT_0007109579 /DNA_START=50 /DNA_END=1636 /DNA_ORIENTATION=-